MIFVPMILDFDIQLILLKSYIGFTDNKLSENYTKKKYNSSP